MWYGKTVAYDRVGLLVGVPGMSGYTIWNVIMIGWQNKKTSTITGY